MRVHVLVACLCWLAACSRPIEHEGFQREHARLQEVQVNQDTCDTVKEKLGLPTIEMVYPDVEGSTVWYYVSRKVQENTFSLPTILEQKTCELRFNKQGVLQQVNESDKHIDVPMSAHVTESNTYESGVMRDVFGSFGQNLSKKKSS